MFKKYELLMVYRRSYNSCTAIGNIEQDVYQTVFPAEHNYSLL